MKLLLISPQDVYATTRLIKEAQKQGIEITHYSATHLVEGNFQVNPENCDALYVRIAYPYYKEVGRLAKKFTKLGKIVIDEAVRRGEIEPDKLADYAKMIEIGVRCPNTTTFNEFKLNNYPVVLKTKYGFGKKEVFLITNPSELERTKKLYKEQDLIVQQYIEADFEYKVFVVGNTALPIVLKYKVDKSGFGIDANNFQILDSSKYTEVTNLAEQAATCLGKELSKIDILESGQKLYVLEVNRSPGFQSFELTTKYNVASVFISYINELIGRKLKKML